MNLLKRPLVPLNSIIFIVILLFSSCAKDEDLAPDGDDRTKYAGTWNCKETVQGQAPTSFPIEINLLGSSDTLLVTNFNQLGTSTQTYWLISDNSITIPLQTVTAVALSGYGFYSNNKISLNYTSDNETVTAECTK